MSRFSSEDREFDEEPLFQGLESGFNERPETPVGGMGQRGLPGHHGRDSENVVVVTVDEEGAVQAVAAENAWRTIIAPSGLGPKLAEAARNAEIQRTQTRAHEALTATAGARDGIAANTCDDQINGIGVESTLDVSSVLDFLDRLDKEITQLENRLETPEQYYVTANGSGGHIAVSIDSGQVATVEVDSSWASTANHLDLASEALSAFRNAQAVAKASDPMLRTDSAIGEARALTSNPQEFIRRLGLDNPGA